MQAGFIVKARRALLLMQVFSTLGFAVLYSSLVLYATQKLNLTGHQAVAITGGFLAFNYTLHALGGYIGGRFLSYRGLFVVGMLLQSLGVFLISFPYLATLIVGLSAFLAGSGLNVICINCMLTQLFDAQDKRRESAFLWNYSGMNLGFFIGFTMSGFFQLNQDFHTLFLFASLGSIISFVLALFYWKYLEDKGTIYVESKNQKQRMGLAALIIIGLVAALTWLLGHAKVANGLIFLGGTFVALLFVYFAWSEPNRERSKKMWAYIVLGLSSLIFWTLYQLAPMGLTLFYVHNVQQQLFGITIPAQWMGNINTIVIVLGGPLMAYANRKLRHQGYKITIPFQFTTALFLIGIGVLLLPIGIHFADENGISNIWWFIGSYAVQSCGELFISPIAYAMIGQLMPARLQALAMGSWIMVVGVAAVLSDYASQMALGSSNATNPLITNPTFSSAFFKLGMGAVLTGVILFFLRKFLHRLIQEKHSLKSIEPAPYNAPQE